MSQSRLHSDALPSAVPHRSLPRHSIKMLDDQLLKRNIQHLKFLCRDLLPPAQLETASRAINIFEMLSTKGYISGNDMTLVATLLRHIGRLDLVRKITCPRTGEMDDDWASAAITEYRILLHKICEEITSREFDTMKYFCADWLPRSRQATTTDMWELVIGLEQAQVITPHKLAPLKNLLEDIERPDLASLLTDYIVLHSRDDDEKQLKGYDEALHKPVDEMFCANSDLQPSWQGVDERNSGNLGLWESPTMHQRIGSGGETAIVASADDRFQQQNTRSYCYSEDLRASTTAVPSYNRGMDLSTLTPESQAILGRVMQTGGQSRTQVPPKASKPQTRPPSSHRGEKKNPNALKAKPDEKGSARDSPRVSKNLQHPKNAGEEQGVCAAGKREDQVRVPQSGSQVTIGHDDPVMPCYRMNAKPRGIALIISNECFHTINPAKKPLDTRLGGQHDREKLEAQFKELHFNVLVKKDLTRDQIISCLIDIASNIDHTNYDCFVCCLLSHGAMGQVYGADGQALPTFDLMNPFKAMMCGGLAGKPKLFFIQACQGKVAQPGYPVKTDAPSEEGLHTPSIPNDTDFLLGFSTTPGYVSFRSEEEGSWYVSKLVEMLARFSASYDLLSILTKVNFEVGQAVADMGGDVFKQCPAPFHTLRKKVFLGDAANTDS